MLKGYYISPPRGCEWEARYSVAVNGKAVRKPAACETFREALLVRAQNGPIVREAQASTAVASSSSDPKEMRFGEFVDVYRATYLPHLGRSAQKNIESRLHHFGFLHGYRMKDIKAAQIWAWLAHVKAPEYLKAYKATRESYRYEMVSLRSIFRFYRETHNEDYVLPFLSAHAKHLVVRKVHKEKKDLSLEEFKTFIGSLRKICTGERVVFVYLALFQYAIYGRIQDAAALHFEDFEDDKVSVRRKVEFVHKKGEAPRLVEGSKSNAGKEIPSTPFIRNLVREWAMLSGRRRGPLFTFGGELLRYRQIQHWYDKALRDAGIRFTGTHLIRHASLTQVQERTKDVQATAKLAGHRNVSSTYRYVDVRSEKLKNAQEEMGRELAAVLDS